MLSTCSKAIESSLPPCRLIIDKIVLENFKSYAGRQEIGPFHKSFSSIVGPNGSGKSNVIDAVMFVLGYRAKKMRQAKLADLIHVSEGMMELESCTVEVHFKLIRDLEGDDYEDVAKSEVIVSRTAYRNNRNVYYINGTSSNYEGVTGLLRGYGIDLDHKRFLILQGEVEAIAMMKPKGATEHEEGLLEYLEDIIGTNQYIQAIEEKAKELDAANTIHSDRILRVRVAENECSALLGEKEEAESYLRQENTLTERRSELLQATIWQSQRQLTKLEKTFTEKRVELEEEQTKNANDVLLAKELDSTVNMATDEAMELEKLMQKLQSELTSLEQSDVRMQETRKHLKSKLKTLTKQSTDVLVNSIKQEADLVRRIEDANVSIATLEKDLGERRTEYNTASADLDKISASLKGVTASHQKNLDLKQAELVPLQEKLRAVQQDLEISKTSLHLIEAKERLKQDEREKLVERLQKVTKEIKDAELKRSTLEEQFVSMKNKSLETAACISKMESDCSNRQRQLQLLLATTSEAAAAVNQKETGSAVYKALMKESKANRIRGIHGRLGDLGAIDEKYDMAIGTACSYLDHIVVETTQVGQQCIEHLRKDRIGRANFIMLDKMRPAGREAPKDLPKGSQRLFDLVSIKDDRYLEAMYFALGETLVAETLDQARLWAYGTKRWRVVTLDGKLFEASGTVSGGGVARRGGMGSHFKEDTEQVTMEQVQLLQDQCRLAQQELKQLLSSQSQEQTQLANQKDTLLKIEAELSLVQRLLQTLPVEREMIEAQLSTKDQESSLDEGEQGEARRLREAISLANNLVEKVNSMIKPVEASISQIQQQILDAGGMRFKVQHSKVEGLSEQIKSNEQRLKDINKEKMTIERKLLALQSGKRDELAIKQVELELVEVEKQIKETTGVALNLHQELSQVQIRMEELTGRVKELKGKLDSVNRSVAKFRKVEYELQCSIEKDESSLAELRETIDHSKRELAKLHLHHIDGNGPKPMLAHYEDRDLAEFAREMENLKQKIQVLEQRLERSRPNLRVLDEYRSREMALQSQKEELEKVEEHCNSIKANFEELRRKRLDEFMTGFRTISNRLKEMYQLITLGGNAELELVDSLDPFAEGVLFSVMPPKKSWRNISNLSGGEKTLSSLALVFALHSFRPTPIYIMDEIDAALDFRNVSIVAQYIRERTRDAQFLVVSLRNNMFELADRLIGIYKTFQRTKSISIDPRHFIPPNSSDDRRPLLQDPNPPETADFKSIG